MGICSVIHFVLLAFHFEVKAMLLTKQDILTLRKLMTSIHEVFQQGLPPEANIAGELGAISENFSREYVAPEDMRDFIVESGYLLCDETMQSLDCQFGSYHYEHFNFLLIHCAQFSKTHVETYNKMFDNDEFTHEWVRTRGSFFAVNVASSIYDEAFFKAIEEVMVKFQGVRVS